MTAAAATLARDLAARGVRLEARGDRLHVEAPPGVLDDALRDALRTAKPELLSLLAGDGDPLPLAGDPRRPVLELVDDVWSAGCYVVVAGCAASIHPRALGAIVPGALRDRLRALERDVVALLALVP